MIHIDDKSKCCGCNTCVQRCPKQCIVMHEDEEGFLYPQVDVTLCIDCGLCEKVCPVINQNMKKDPIVVFAMQHMDKGIRLKSSSGGIFTFIATNIIEEGGIVFGARWNEKLELVHDYTETKEGLSFFCGSKYVQSCIGNIYKDVEYFVKNKRRVLFTGTPCQVAGLKKFLHKEYENLLTVDILCHGVPSPRVFRNYLTYIGKGEKIVNFDFRDKSTGWKGYSVKYVYENGKIKRHSARLDEYMRAYLNHYMLRPSCHVCPAKAGKSGSDITLGDLWGANQLPMIKDDDTGLSVVIVNTEKGEKNLNLPMLANVETLDVSFVKRYNSAYYVSSSCSPFRNLFWKDYHKKGIMAMISLNDKIGPTISQVKFLLFKTKVAKMLKYFNM